MGNYDQGNDLTKINKWAQSFIYVLGAAKSMEVVLQFTKWKRGVERYSNIIVALDGSLVSF
mgnify:CR=1 FL=1